MNFERGINPKISMDMGLYSKLQSILPDYINIHNSGQFTDMWKFGMQSNLDWVISYLSTFHGKKWGDGNIIDLSSDNNEILWKSIESKNIHAVKEILSHPGLFPVEALKIDRGTSTLENEYVDYTNRKVRVTNIGSFINLAIEFYPNKEIETILKCYLATELIRINTPRL